MNENETKKFESLDKLFTIWHSLRLAEDLCNQGLKDEGVELATEAEKKLHKLDYKYESISETFGKFKAFWKKFDFQQRAQTSALEEYKYMRMALGQQ